MFYTINMIYQVGLLRRSFTRKTFPPKTSLDFPVLLYFSLMVIKIHILWNLLTNSVVFIPVMIFVFFVFLNYNIQYTKKHVHSNICTKIHLFWVITYRVTTAGKVHENSRLLRLTLLTSLTYLVYCVPQSIAYWIHFIHESSFYSY